MKRSEIVIKEALAEMFDFLAYKVRHDAMTTDDIRAVLAVLESGGGVKATAKDLADFFHQSEDNVRHILHRNYMKKPTRRVYYDFGSFRDVVPKKWHERATLPAD